MSKSLGNFFNVRDILPRLRPPEVLRYFLLGSHYRGPINYALPQLEQADMALGRLYNALRDLPVVAAAPGRSAFRERFEAAMQEDFNTAEALAVLQTLAREINTLRAADDCAQAAALAAEFRALAGLLGIVQLDPAEWFRLSLPVAGESGEALSDAEVEQRISARLAARKAKDFAASDRLRDELAAQGVLLEDKPGGITTWRRK